MGTLVESREITAVDVSCTKHVLHVVLADGRAVSVPLAWFPRLLEATPKQRAAWEFIGGDIGVHWEEIDEDISVASLLQPEKFVSLPHNPTQPPTAVRARSAKSAPARRRG